METPFPTFRRWASRQPSFRSWWPRRTRPAQQQALLRLIAAATEEHVPLAPLLLRWAGDERGIQQRRIFRLAKLLQEGTTLPDAVEQVPGVLRDEDILAIRFGAQSGVLVPALRDAVADATDPPTNRTPRWRWTVGYGGIVAWLYVFVTAFIYIKIVPAFESIIEDFGVDLPPAQLLSIKLVQFVERFWWVAGISLLLLVWSLFSARPGRFIRRHILDRFFKPLRELRGADIIRKLSVAARAGRPIGGSLSTLARYHFDPSTRAKLLFVRNEVEQGADVWQSMGSAGILAPPEVNLLDAADRLGNRGWTLAQVAAGKKRRTMRRLERLSELSLPVTAFVLGGIVLLQGVSLFTTLAKLITSLV